MPNQKIFYVALTLVGLVTLIVYLPALGNGFVEWDDRAYVFENIGIRSINAQSLYWMFFDYHAANWHPLTWLSLAIDYSFWGLDPKGYHLTNILLHAMNTSLVVILARMLYFSATRNNRLALSFAVLTGLLFGLHPIHVESVAWVSERKDLLYCFFYLLSIIFYLEHQNTNNKLDYFLCFFTFLLSALSKPMAVSLPFVLVALDYYPLRSIRFCTADLLKSIRGKLPLFALVVFLAATTFFVQRESGAMQNMEIIGLGERLLMAQWALVFYLYKVFVPTGYIYLYLIPSNLTLINPVYSIPLAINAAALIVFYKLRNKVPLLAVSAFIYVVTLLPVLGIVQVGGQAVADRYMYFTLLVPVMLVSSGVIYIREKIPAGSLGRIAVHSILVVALMGLSYLTVEQVRVWKNTISLASNAIKHNPEHNHAYTKRVDAYQQLGMYREVVEDMNKVIEINSRYPTRAVNPRHWDYAFRGDAYLKLAMYEEAVQSFSEAIASNNTSHEYYRKRAKAYELSGEVRPALSDYLRALELSPGDIGLRYKVATIQYELGMYEDAIMHLNTAIQANPNIGILYFNRALNYEKQGDEDMVGPDLRRASELGVLQARKALEERGVR